MAPGKLRIYLGAAPGVGKTFAMLDEGWRRRDRGTDVVIGFVEPHNRPKTMAQIRDLPVIPRRRLEYRGQVLDEMDVDAVLARHPAVALVDELAHTNVPGSRNEKRWQDVEELLAEGVDVISTVNIQHLASVNDVVEHITGVVQRETVPDAVVRSADQVELVDMAPEALRRRMAHGNIYPPEKIDIALAHYFREGNLGALRELALLWMADRVDEELASYRQRHGIHEPWETKERIVVALSGAPGGEHLLRRAARIAARSNGELVGVHVRAADGLMRPEPAGLEAQRQLLGELKGRYTEVSGVDEAEALVRFARAENATQLVLGATGRSRMDELLRGSVVNRVVRDAAPIDVHVISPKEPPGPGLPRAALRHRPAAVPPRRRDIALFLATVGIASLAAALSPLQPSLQVPGALLFMLLGVVLVATLGGLVPALVATVVGSLSADFFFVPPFDSLRVAHPAGMLALVVFVLVAATVSVLVDQLIRRGLQVSRSQAEVESLARLAGASVISGTKALPDIVGELRQTFNLDSVAILAPVAAHGDLWRPVASAGATVPVSPAAANFSVDLDEGNVLVLYGHALSAEDTRLLGAFVSQLRMAQERLRLESEAATAEQLAEANNLRSALLAAVSHDLRTPLASIKAAVTSLLSKEVKWGPDEVTEFYKTIDSEADRLAHLIADLLDMGRLRTGTLPVLLTPVAVDSAIVGALASLPSTSGLEISIPDNLPLAQADAGLLERALANVMSNAQKWSPPGKPARVEAGPAGDRVDIRVMDRGPGIARERRDEVFTPFQGRGDGRGRGNGGFGLGLAVAKGFTEAMGGTLVVDDTPGGGATLVFSLERADVNQPENPDAPQPSLDQHVAWP